MHSRYPKPKPGRGDTALQSWTCKKETEPAVGCRAFPISMVGRSNDLDNTQCVIYLSSLQTAFSIHCKMFCLSTCVIGISKPIKMSNFVASRVINSSQGRLRYSNIKKYEGDQVWKSSSIGNEKTIRGRQQKKNG